MSPTRRALVVFSAKATILPECGIDALSNPQKLDDDNAFVSELFVDQRLSKAPVRLFPPNTRTV